MIKNQNNNTTYSYAQLESIWKQAATGTKYDTDWYAALMAAIAEAESSGDPNSLNATDNGGTQSSFGLWQISTGSHTPPAANWADPVENAKLAIGKLQTQGLSAWGTYDSGAYKKYLSYGTSPDNSWTKGYNGATNGGQGIAGVGGAGSSGSTTDTCLMNINYGIGSVCLMSKTNARAMVGGLLMVGSLMLFTVSGIVLVSAGFRRAAPAVGALAKGPVGMLAGAAMKSGSGEVSRSKTTIKDVPKEESNPAPVPRDTTPSGGTGRHRGASGEKSDKQSGKGKRRGTSAPLPSKDKPAAKIPEDAKPGAGKRRKVTA